MHFNLSHAGRCAAKALRQILCKRLYIRHTCTFLFYTIDSYHTQILRWRGFDAHVPAYFRSNAFFGFPIRDRKNSAFSVVSYNLPFDIPFGALARAIFMEAD